MVHNNLMFFSKTKNAVNAMKKYLDSIHWKVFKAYGAFEQVMEFDTGYTVKEINDVFCLYVTGHDVLAEYILTEAVNDGMNNMVSCLTALEKRHSVDYVTVYKHPLQYEPVQYASSKVLLDTDWAKAPNMESLLEYFHEMIYQSDFCGADNDTMFFSRNGEHILELDKLLHKLYGTIVCEDGVEHTIMWYSGWVADRVGDVTCLRVDTRNTIGKLILEAVKEHGDTELLDDVYVMEQWYSANGIYAYKYDTEITTVYDLSANVLEYDLYDGFDVHTLKKHLTGEDLKENADETV